MKLKAKTAYERGPNTDENLFTIRGLRHTGLVPSQRHDGWKVWCHHCGLEGVRLYPDRTIVDYAVKLLKSLSTKQRTPCV